MLNPSCCLGTVPGELRLIGVGIAWLGFRMLGNRAQRWLLVALVVALVALASGFFTWLQVTGIQFRL
jgi:hypothetical protein